MIEALRLRLAALLNTPDDPDLVGRGRHFVCARDPRQHPDDILKRLDVAYAQWRKQDYGQDISRVVSVRRQPLKIVRRA